MKYTYENKTNRRLTIFFKDESFFMYPNEKHTFNGKVELEGLELIDEIKVEKTRPKEAEI